MLKFINYTAFFFFCFLFFPYFSYSSTAENETQAYEMLQELNEIETILLSDYYISGKYNYCIDGVFEDLLMIIEEREQIKKEWFYTPVSKKKQCQRVRKVGWSTEASWWFQRGLDISDCDKEFVVMMNAENAKGDYKRQSDYMKNGVREDSWGFCQIHRPSHPDIVNDPRFFTSQEWQLGECLRLWRERPSQFYGYTDSVRREYSRKGLIFE